MDMEVTGNTNTFNRNECVALFDDTLEFLVKILMQQ